jgi:hypothetical protein
MSGGQGGAQPAGASADAALRAFLDREDRISRWPKKMAEKSLVLDYLASKFESGRRYSEPEVNAIIRQWHAFDDIALLRRELYDTFRLDRTKDGRAYWRQEG